MYKVKKITQIKVQKNYKDQLVTLYNKISLVNLS